MRPETRYTNVGDAQIAYQVVGDGPPDLVCFRGLGSCIDLTWDHPPAARTLERLASFSRLILFDRRGTGSSDPVPLEALGSWEHYTEDLEAVLDAAGSEQAILYSTFEAGPVAMLFAAARPERTRALILVESSAKSIVGDDYPIGVPRQAWEDNISMIVELWGTEGFAALFADLTPDRVDEARWVAKLLRLSATPRSAGAQLRHEGDMDVRHALPLIQAPTLVMNSATVPLLTVEMGRYVADHIKNARFVELDSSPFGHTIFGTDEVLDAIEEFITGTRPATRSNRVLSTVMFTDFVGSTERLVELGDERWRALLESHEVDARRGVAAHGGRFVKSTGDGLLATFDLPGRAIQCALELAAAAPGQTRTGIHSGEIELMPAGDIGGIAVHIAQRVESAAEPGCVFCTRTVKDLVAGSGIHLEDRGPHALKGVPDEWQLFAVRP